MLIYFVICSLLVWGFVVGAHFVRTGNLKFHHFSFSQTNYYIMLSGGVFAVLLDVLVSRSMMSLITFLVFAIAGVIGETILSAWWHAFFAKRFWVYQIDTLFHSYTSFLNFIPYGFGGLVYIELTKRIVSAQELGAVFSNNNITASLILLFLCIFIQFILFNYLKKKNHEYKFHKVTVLNYFFFLFPSVVAIGYLVFRFGNNLLWIACLFATIPTLLEYMFGKATQFFISKKMWEYTYLAVDHGHFTPLTIPLFAIGGFYFLLIDGIVAKFFFL